MLSVATVVLKRCLLLDSHLAADFPTANQTIRLMSLWLAGICCFARAGKKVRVRVNQRQVFAEYKWGKSWTNKLSERLAWSCIFHHSIDKSVINTLSQPHAASFCPASKQLHANLLSSSWHQSIQIPVNTEHIWTLICMVPTEQLLMFLLLFLLLLLAAVVCGCDDTNNTASSLAKTDCGGSDLLPARWTCNAIFCKCMTTWTRAQCGICTCNICTITLRNKQIGYNVEHSIKATHWHVNKRQREHVWPPWNIYAM